VVKAAGDSTPRRDGNGHSSPRVNVQFLERASAGQAPQKPTLHASSIRIVVGLMTEHESKTRSSVFEGPVGLRRASRHPETLTGEWSLDGCETVVFEGEERPSIAGIPLLVKLGSGGMGVVYCGIDPEDGSEVAVKVMPRSIQAQHATALERFIREGQLATQIRSDHLVSVRRVGEDSHTHAHYLVMECVAGMTAATWVEKFAEGRGTGGPIADALAVVIAAARGLAAAHDADIVHRDVKPENVLIPVVDDVPQCDKAKLSDLGLAKPFEPRLDLTATATGLGTAGFMSPEQLEDAKRVTAAADVFSLGATLYSLLTGSAPFRGASSVMAIVNTMKGEFPPLRSKRAAVSGELEALVHRCLTRDATQRPQNGAELLAALLELPPS